MANGGHHVIDDMTPEQLEKVRALRRKNQSVPASRYCNQNERLYAEFGEYYGWGAVRDVMLGHVEAGTFFGMLFAGRRQHTINRIERLQDMWEVAADLNAKDGHGDQHLKAEIKRLQAQL